MVDDSARCHYPAVSTGSKQLDQLLTGLLPGDNVVWQVDSLDEYSRFAVLFARQSVLSGGKCIYLRFAGHEAILKPTDGVEINLLDPAEGFDSFSHKVHDIIEDRGGGSSFIFDNLSALVDRWATDELLADFYQVICPYIYELKSIAYFALNRDQHDYSSIARIKTTTQILLSIYRAGGSSYIHPLKVWKRYSPNMFLTHLMKENGEWMPIATSFDAAAVVSASGKNLIRTLPDSDSPWNTVYRKLAYYEDGNASGPEAESEIYALKAELTRMMFGEHEKINLLADTYMKMQDVLAIRRRLIGSGRIGGKAAGMLLARKVLLSGEEKDKFSRIFEEHDSFYIGSDVFFSFLVNNDLFRLRLKLSRKQDLSEEEFGEVEKEFERGVFPEEIIEQFRDMLDHYGQAPIIVRSSSLMEDGFRHAYAGKYRSEFCPNQGSPEQRLAAFLKALKLVFASALNPDVISYRRKMALTEGDEQMAILVQRVSGMPHERYFFPTLAGVAFSRNLYAWSERINPERGMIRMVLGLGTRAVNRIGGDYPRMISISNPMLRPEAPEKIPSYSQKKIDLINIETNQFSTEPVGKVLGAQPYPNIELLASSFSEGFEHDITSQANWQDVYHLTFRNLLQKTDFVRVMGEMLSKLETAWGQPVDIEFTAHISSDNQITVNLLQCRSLKMPIYSEVTDTSKKEAHKQRVLFFSNKALGAGSIEDIRYIIYVHAEKYGKLDIVNKKQVGRIIGKLNQILSVQPGRVMLIGPGRWGSGNIELGINVSFADISCVSVLVEVASETAGFAPEASFGTHFFLDLVENGTIYIPLFPGEQGFFMDEDYFNISPSVLGSLLPDWVDYSEVVRVIDVADTSQGLVAALYVNPAEKSAECFLMH
ncbi:MAG: PEP/pyruvate-binding domain-containing protein [Dehalococcoidales bacterium]